MKKVVLALLLCAIGLWSAPSPKKPKLVVLVAVDQFRFDYLYRFRSSFTGGIARMLDRGAVFTDAYYEHFPTVTAVGHSTMLSGATPSISGIVGNEWFDRQTGKQVTSVSDSSAELLGGAAGQKGSSPHRLLVSTVGDQMKMANGRAKVVGISSKDRSAILPAGRMANGAYWFDTGTGSFVSSTYYFKQMPSWAAKFNDSRIVDRWAGKEWAPIDPTPGQKPFGTLPAKGAANYYNVLDRTPFHNELLELFAEAAIEGEELGADDATDLLSVSFSANDRIGHAVGPDAPEVRDVTIVTDRVLGKFFEYLDKRLGAENYVVVMTADHGVAPLPEVMAERKMPGGRMPEGTVLNAVQTALNARFGEGKWVVGSSGPAPYLNYQLINDKKLNLEEVQNVAAAALRELPHIYRVYTRSELRRGGGIGDLIETRVRAGFHYQRASDLFVVSEPYWLFEASGTSHGTPYNYDAHVPVIFMGSGIKAGRYNAHIAVNDIAPTLTNMLDVETPSGSVGRVLTEMLAQQ